MTESPWSPIVLAYERDIAILEEARASYRKAVGTLLSSLRVAISQQIPPLPRGVEPEIKIEEDDDDGGLAEPEYLWCALADRAALKVRLSAWVASSWGGSPGTLRLGVCVEPPSPFLFGQEADDLARHLSGTFGSDLPGTPFDPAAHVDAGPGAWIRLAEVRLVDRSWEEILREAAAMAAGLLSQIALPALKWLQEEAAPVLRAEALLLEARNGLERRAGARGVEIQPKTGLGNWEKGKCLQIGGFWLATDPVGRRMLAESWQKERQAVDLLASRLGRTVDKRAENASFVLLGPQELLSPDAEQAVRDAFQAWFDANPPQGGRKR
ncbi:MAG: hypothetical protein ABIO70_10335 [Pseudomonadota bacterium]